MTHVITDGDDTGEMVSDLTHAHLEDILTELQVTGHLQNWYLPLWVLNIIRYELFSSRSTLPKPSLVSSLKNVIALLSQWEILSSAWAYSPH